MALAVLGNGSRGRTLDGHRVTSHLMAFAAERSRRTRRTEELASRVGAD